MQEPAGDCTASRDVTEAGALHPLSLAPPRIRPPSLRLFGVVKVFVDTTEPGIVFQALAQRAAGEGIVVERSILHKRDGQGGALRDRHPFYGLGADFVIVDEAGVPLCGIERKTLEELARSASLQTPGPGEQKIFRQLRDLTVHPCPIFLLEGRPSVLYRRVEPSVLGLQFWCAREGIALMFSTSPLASAHAVFLIARKLKREGGDFQAPGAEPGGGTRGAEGNGALSEPPRQQPAQEP